MPYFNPASKFTIIAICGFHLPAAQAEAFTGKVVGIADGDTLTVLTASTQQHKVRLAEIDASEKHQPFGTKSKQSLSDLCFGKEAEIIASAKDRYKRTVARVKCAGIDANAAQVNRGMAWVCRQYARGADLYALERAAIIGKRGLWADPSPIPPGNSEGVRGRMCGRFEQSETRLYYARALLPDVPEHKWAGGDIVRQYNISPGRPVLTLQRLNGQLDSDHVTWGYRTAKENCKPWINARIEKALSGRYFRHMFGEGRAIIPGGGWFEWTLENGKKQPCYLTCRNGQPIFMAAITNLKPFSHQSVEVGTVIVTEDSK